MVTPVSRGLPAASTQPNNDVAESAATAAPDVASTKTGANVPPPNADAMSKFDELAAQYGLHPSVSPFASTLNRSSRETMQEAKSHEAIFDAIDTNKNGKLDTNELVHGAKCLTPEAMRNFMRREERVERRFDKPVVLHPDVEAELQRDAAEERQADAAKGLWDDDTPVPMTASQHDRYVDNQEWAMQQARLKGFEAWEGFVDSIALPGAGRPAGPTPTAEVQQGAPLEPVSRSMATVEPLPAPETKPSSAPLTEPKTGTTDTTDPAYWKHKASESRNPMAGREVGARDVTDVNSARAKRSTTTDHDPKGPQPPAASKVANDNAATAANDNQQAVPRKIAVGDPHGAPTGQPIRAGAGNGRKGNGHEDDSPRRAQAPSTTKVTGVHKVDLKNSAELKKLLPSAQHRTEFMAWLKQNHVEGDLGQEIPLNQKPPKGHDHVNPGTGLLEQLVNEWKAETGKGPRSTE